MTTKIIFFNLGIFLFLASCASNDKQTIPVVNSLLDTQELGLNHVASKIEKTHNLEYTNREDLKQDLKAWNPHIRNWSSIGHREPIYVKKKKFTTDLALTSQATSYKEKFPNSEELSTTTSNSGISLSGALTLSPNSSLLFDGNYLVQSNFSDSENEVKILDDYSLDVHYEFNIVPSAFSFNTGVGLQKKSQISVDPGLDTTQELISESLSDTTYDYLWMKIGTSIRSSIMNNRTIYRLSFARSFYSRIIGTNTTLSQQAILLDASMEQSIGKKVFVNTSAYYIDNENDRSSISSTLSLSLGYRL